MKNKKVLALFGGILIALLGLLYFVSKEPVQEIPLEQDFVSYEALVEFTKDEISSIVVENQDIHAVFIPTEQGFELEDTDDLGLSTSTITTYANRLLSVYPNKTLEEVSSLEEYGLSNPFEKIIYNLQDGSSITLSLGNRAPGTVGVYALKDEDPSTVYIIPTTVISSLDGSYSKFRTATLDTPDPSTVSRVEIKGRDLDHYVIGYLDANTEAYYATYLMESPYKLVVSGDAYGRLLEAIPPLSVETYVADRVEDFSLYGLDNPSLWLSLELTDSEGNVNTLEYSWGDLTEDGQIYFMPKESSSVYAMSASLVDTFLTHVDPYKLSSKLVGLVNIDLVNTLDVQIGTKALSLSIERNGEDTTYLLNGNPIEEKDFKTLYQAIIGITSDVRLDKDMQIDATPVVTFDYTLTDGSNQTTTFYPYNNQFYSYSLADNFLVGCTIRQFNHILTVAEKIEPLQ
jgi:hypothetical protein